MENKQKDQLQFLKVGIRTFQAKQFDLEFVTAHGFTCTTLLNYTFHTDIQISFRAAWLLEHVSLKEPAWVPSIYTNLIFRLHEQKNWGTIRCLTKIIMLATTKKYSAIHQPEQDNILLEQCFKWITDPSCPVAVIVNCLDILHQVSERHDWVKEELIAQINHLLKNPTPALASRAKRLLKRIL